jgi:hypothetical protein
MLRSFPIVAAAGLAEHAIGEPGGLASAGDFPTEGNITSVAGDKSA